MTIPWPINAGEASTFRLYQVGNCKEDDGYSRLITRLAPTNHRQPIDDHCDVAMTTPMIQTH